MVACRVESSCSTVAGAQLRFCMELLRKRLPLISSVSHLNRSKFDVIASFCGSLSTNARFGVTIPGKSSEHPPIWEHPPRHIPIRDRDFRSIRQCKLPPFRKIITYGTYSDAARFLDNSHTSPFSNYQTFSLHTSYDHPPWRTHMIFFLIQDLIQTIHCQL